MSNRDSRDSDSDADGADAQLTSIHVTAVLVASVRAMSNALDALGFAEDDDRVVEQDDRFGFVTCSHEQDCDDMFALIAELSASGETWEIQFQADLAPGRMLFHTLSRHRSIVAHEQQIVPHPSGTLVLMVALAPALCGETLDEFLPRLPVQTNHRFALCCARQSPS